MKIHWMFPKSFKKRLVLGFAILGKIIAVCFILSYRTTNKCSNSATDTASLTVIIRDFEDFENDIPASVKSIQNALPESRVLIVADTIPYPPLSLNEAYLVVVSPSLDQSVLQSRPDTWFASKHILFVPDGVRVSQHINIQLMVEYLENQPADVRLAVWPLSHNDRLACVGLNVSTQQWTARYYISMRSCNAVTGGPFALLIRREDLMSLSDPFARPFSTAIFLQTALRGWNVAIGAHSPFQMRSPRLFTSAHSLWKHNKHNDVRLIETYHRLGIKQLKMTDGQSTLYGCHRDKPRCFSTVVDDVPDYIRAGRWTPPCCLQGIRETAAHVFRSLDAQSIPYWLEGGSLLGAVRAADIIPWDYDVDIGIYRDDIEKSHILVACREGKSVEDENGFVWEKATEGDFYRVQYSRLNHLHVDIFPFYAQNGVMTKDTWFKTHRQDMEFPEHFLKPLLRIPFIGMNVSVPNNYRQFLELKFGEGVIENPQYPNSKKVFVNEKDKTIL